MRQNTVPRHPPLFPMLLYPFLPGQKGKADHKSHSEMIPFPAGHQAEYQDKEKDPRRSLFQLRQLLEEDLQRVTCRRKHSCLQQSKRRFPLPDRLLPPHQPSEKMPPEIQVSCRSRRYPRTRQNKQGGETENPSPDRHVTNACQNANDRESHEEMRRTEPVNPEKILCTQQHHTDKERRIHYPVSSLFMGMEPFFHHSLPSRDSSMGT